MPCSDQRVRVIIEEEEVPTTNVVTEVSNDAQKSGADVTRLTEANIPLSWKDENIVSNIESFDPTSQSSYDRATVLFQNVRQGGWESVHRGFIRGVSGSDTTGVGRVIIQDPAALTSAIPFSNRYTESVSVGEVFNDVASTIRQNSVFNPQPRLSTSRTVNTSGAGAEYVSNSSYGVGTNVADTKAFKSNRHTCADALNWVTDSGGGRWYFEFRSGGSRGLSLVYDNGSQSVVFAQRQSRGGAQEQRLNEGGSFPQCPINQLDIIENDAMADIFPVNTLTVKGATGASIFGHEVAMIPSKKSPWVTVQYPPFVQAAGGNIVGKQVETDNVTLESATNTAKKKLEQTILDSGTGSMLCYGNPYPMPYDTIQARPECADVITGTAPSLPYEVANVTHTKDSMEEMMTRIDVSPVVDPSKITVEEAEMRDV